MFKNVRKADLLTVAKELGEQASPDLTVIELKNLIIASDTYEKDPDFVESFMRSVIEDRISDETKLQSSLELERLKLERVQAELELARIRYENSNSEPQNLKVKTKLPELPLPKFSGKYEEFLNFKTQFNAIISENSFLTETQKLYYLKGALTGEAMQIETSEDSFQSLFKALEDRFDNKRAIVDTHIQNILNFPNSTHESCKELRDLIDTTKRNMRALNTLQLERNDFSDAILVHVITKKLDHETRKYFELEYHSKEIPKLDVLLEFIEKRTLVLESMTSSKPTFKSVRPKSFLNDQPKTKNFIVNSSQSPKKCALCSQNHTLFNCSAFRNMDTPSRFNFARQNKLCLNCLNYHSHACSSKFSCSICKKKHNTLLHFSDSSASSTPSSGPLVRSQRPSGTGESLQVASTTPQPSELNPRAEEFRGATSLFISNNTKTVLLNTAVVHIQGADKREYPVLAILDSASQGNFISDSCAQLLGLKKEKLWAPVSGLNDSKVIIKSKVTTFISNHDGNCRFNLDFLVAPKITDCTPSTLLNVSQVKLPKGIILADPQFFKPKKIDLLIGAEIFFDLLMERKFRIHDSGLLLQESVFGFLVSGALESASTPPSPTFCHLSVLEKLDDTLKAFWEIENIDTESVPISEELKYCDEHFAQTHYRLEDGRYVVKMPLKPEAEEKMLGNSKDLASRRLNQMLKRLQREPILKNLYCDFMIEYKELNHMTEVREDDREALAYYIPHHGVFRPDKSTTKLRVVFNASAKTTTEKSLNDLLLKGGTIQEDLFSIMLRFRKHIFAFIADIKMMFRQILLDSSQHHLQRILWRESQNSEPTKIFSLKTVTYGTTCAPYLATRTLHQLAADEEERFPMASEVVKTDFYMDDILTGAPDLDSAKTLQSELIQLLSCAKMELHKWCSNHPDLYPDTSTDENYSFENHAETEVVKALGMRWHPTPDFFSFQVQLDPSETYTKRDVLSYIARIFDPLGLIGPVITTAKIFLQKLWLLKIDWHERLPPAMASQWTQFVATLPMLESISIPRCILPKDPAVIILQGFADASESAYGAVLYMQCSCGHETNTTLLCSKSRVAPIKTLTIPRLELSACLLLAKLTTKALKALKMDIYQVVLHTDSQIALAWIQTPSHQLKTFVANRVSRIQQLTQNVEWRHVPSAQNPADFISRGLTAEELSTKKLWWNGPQFLNDVAQDNESDHLIKDDYLSELKPSTNNVLTVTLDITFLDNVLSISYNFSKLIRVISFIFRFIHNLRNRNRISGPLTSEELKTAKLQLTKLVQRSHFEREINLLERGESIKHGPLACLNPFLDSNKLLRVGGRLSNAHLSFDKKFPILLPKNHVLTLLIMLHFHQKYLHVGAQTLLYLVRQEFWPLGGRNTARKVVHDCVTCVRNKPSVVEQVMGNLPRDRVAPSPPFTHTGIDFCGPFLIKYKGQRKGIFQKCYVAIFICFATKAIHLEVVTDLTSEAMIATLKRFFSRRGRSKSICTDNATNFVGASAEIKRLHKLFQTPSDPLAKFLSTEEVNWKFIPPRSPNFGGLWESGVKSFKHHLKRSVGNSSLTMEQFITVTTQIEGILNSRPLTPMSSDPNDCDALTPGHFLIGKPILSLPEPDLTSRPDNYLSQWQKLTKYSQLIWRRWSLDYLNNLQARHKWQFEKNNVQVGSMVILKEENLPPNKWLLGRIQETIPGKDGKVRVVIVKTPHGTLKRGISKICLLPITHA